MEGDMAQRKTLNEVQIAVLRWINDGCPDNGVDGISTRISAGALRNRGLVRTRGRGPTWKAAITSAGKEYLRQVDGPNPPLPRPPNVSVTQQLVDDVIAAGGSLRMPRRRWNDKDVVDYERRVRLAESYGRVPRGCRFVVKNASAEELLIELVTDGRFAADGQEDPPGLLPVPVPARLSKYHRVAREFRDRTNLHEVSRKALPRVLRIVHALAVEGERRGYEVSCVRIHEDSYGRTEWRPARDGQLVFTVNGHQLKVRIWEKGAGQRGPYEREMRRWKHDREQPFRLMQFVDRPKPYDSAATGELNIEALDGSYGRQSSWGDRNRWKLEDRLPNLLRELEVQAVEAEERRLAREREEAERQRQWEAAMENAKRRLIEDHRLEVLRNRVRAWGEAEAIRAYCAAVEARHGADAIAADPDAAQWLELARDHADGAQQLPRLPADPDVTHDRLKPYLGGWSPYGPHRW
ncbi:MAG TPA: hypothetical protein VFA44_11685 [Gaiellaceae bacterium]|nr:hypothetical protein [Gaiellaceae bacterium]